MNERSEKKTMSWWQEHRPSSRRFVQLYSALLYNAHLKGFIEGEIYQGNTKAVCVPGLNCYSCPGAVGACPLGSIQNALASSGHRIGWYVIGIILLYGVILGRTVCGWVCPLGLIQELLHKIPTPKIRKSAVTRALSWLKYVILAVFVIAIPLWYGLAYDIPLPGFCKYICPAGTGEGALRLLPTNPSYLKMLGILFTRKFVILLVIGLACIFIYRSFCRFLCPLGAIYGLFNRFNVIGVKVDASRCNHCGSCVRSCGMDVRRVGDHECINCGKCMQVCSQGAISIKAGRVTLKAPSMGCADDRPDAPERRKRFSRIAWGIALAVLCFAVLWYNVLDPSIKKDAAAQAGPVAGTLPDAGKGGESEPGMASGTAIGAGTDAQTEVIAQTEADANAKAASQTETDENAKTASRTETDENAKTASQTETDENAKTASQTEADVQAKAGAQTEAEDQAGAGLETGALIQTEDGKEAAAQADESGDSGEDGSDAQSRSYESNAPIGHEVGQQLADFTAECFDGSTFHLADMRGKIVFINLWATYCTPCVHELPYFSDLYQAHGDDIAMLAVHSPLAPKDDPKEFIAGRGYAMPFTKDVKEETIFQIVGGGATLPQTIVLNRRGEVVYNQVKSVTPEALEALYKLADQQS